MSNDWRSRLKEVIEKDGRSVRAINLAAVKAAEGSPIKLGPNFLQQMLKNGKDPGFTKLSLVLTALGPGATLYVTSGVKSDMPEIIPRSAFRETLARMEGVGDRNAELAMIALTGTATPVPPKSELLDADDRPTSATPRRESPASSQPEPSSPARSRQPG